MFSFEALPTLTNGVSLVLENNANLTLFSASELYSVNIGSTLSLVGSSGDCQIDLPSLGVISGIVIFRGLMTALLQLNALSYVSALGSLRITGNPSLTLWT